MFSKKELKLAYGVAVCLLVIGAISYAAFPVQQPEEPLRLMFQVAAGNVLFNHKIHTIEKGYGLSCFDCHHHPSEDESALVACGSCHPPPGVEVQMEEACLDCHEMEEIEDSKATTRGDAFHIQCINCHKDFEAGPKDCTACHTS